MRGTVRKVQFILIEHSVFLTRSSLNYINSKELINILPDDYYELTEKGKVFMNIYIRQRHR